MTDSSYGPLGASRTSDAAVAEGASTAQAGPKQPKPEKTHSLTGDALRDLVRKPLFLIAAVLILLYIVMSIAPGLFTDVDPTHGNLDFSLQGPSAHAWFGYDLQGRDVFARCIYGARASVIVGVLSALGTSLVGGIIGIVGGYFGGWLDAVLSRITDIFFGLPFLLGAIVILIALTKKGAGFVEITGLVILALVVFGWVQPARIIRSATISAKAADYVQAARSLGASPLRIITRHILPNAVAPLIVFASVSLGAFIAAGATLSYLGIGLHYPVVSWGLMISGAQGYVQTAPHEMLFPAAFLAVCVLSFVMLGDAVQEALDPKLR